jgi:hypothetical protein
VIYEDEDEGEAAKKVDPQVALTARFDRMHAPASIAVNHISGERRATPCESAKFRPEARVNSTSAVLRGFTNKRYKPASPTKGRP